MARQTHIGVNNVLTSFYCSCCTVPADNWKVCSSPECPGNPVNYRVKDKPAKDKECDRPPFKEGVGVGGIGFVDVGFTSNNPSYSCTGSSDCEGSCSKTLGVCPTSSCIANNLGELQQTVAEVAALPPHPAILVCAVVAGVCTHLNARLHPCCSIVQGSMQAEIAEGTDSKCRFTGVHPA